MNKIENMSKNGQRVKGAQLLGPSKWTSRLGVPVDSEKLSINPSMSFL